MDNKIDGAAQFPEHIEVPAVAVRDMVIFPSTLAPVFMGRAVSVDAARKAYHSDTKYVFVVTQKDPEVNDPKQEDCYQVGTLSTVMQFFTLPDGTSKMLVEGLARYKVDSLETRDGMIVARATRFKTEISDANAIQTRRAQLITDWKN